MPNQKCLACLNEITERAIDLSTENKELREKLLNKIMEKTEKEFDQIKLPDYSTEIFSIIAQETGTSDPFLEIKKESNKYFQDLVSKIVNSFEGKHMKNIIRELFLFTIAANMVDFSTGGHTVDLDEIARTIIQFPDEGLAINDFQKLYDYITDAKKIVYLSDNCGEVVVDNLMVDLLVNTLKKETYLGLKGGPVANDCSLEDFERDKLPFNATETFIVSNSFGYNLHQVTDKFKDLIKDADLLIVKGQSNYETTLNNLVRYPDLNFPPTFCILRTKCKVITKSLGVPLGSNVIKQMHPLPKEERAKLVEIVEWKDC
ncbi:MAG: damage-control phosphatase ARMT1 family protein [Candidatus Heimdallarchaeota archaeon]